MSFSLSSPIIVAGDPGHPLSMVPFFKNYFWGAWNAGKLLDDNVL
jgi:hypothetical protein